MTVDKMPKRASALEQIDVPRPKDLVANALILGVAAAAWFGWGHDGAGTRLGVVLSIGSVLGLVLAAISWRTWPRMPGQGTHEVVPGAGRTYGLAILSETVVIVIGALVLSLTNHADAISAWTLAVVGIHFLPLARLYRIRMLDGAAVALVLIAALAFVAGRSGWSHPAPVAGGLGGLALLIVSGLSLRQARAIAQASVSTGTR